MPPDDILLNKAAIIERRHEGLLPRFQRRHVSSGYSFAAIAPTRSRNPAARSANRSYSSR